jgi:two-component system OmpR family sensor kinase
MIAPAIARVTLGQVLLLRQPRAHTGLVGARAGTRRARPSWSVRSRLLSGLLIVSALGMAGGGAVTFLIQRQRVLASVDSALLSRVYAARMVVLGASNSKPTDPAASPAVPEPFRSNSAALAAIVGRVIPDAHESSLGIVDGRAKFVPGVATDFQLQAIPGFVARVVSEEADGKPHLGTVAASGRSVRYVSIPVSVAGSTQPAIYVSATDLNAELADVTSAFITYWQVIAVSLLVIAASGWFISGRLLRPIRDVRIAAEHITSSNRSERIPVRGRDDLSQLTGTVNEMLDRLDGAMTGQRQLLDDVRHELNTPITIVLGHLEILDVHDPVEVQETRDLAIDELGRVAALVQDLASLAETEKTDPVRQNIDVRDFAAHVFTKVRVLPGHDWRLSPVDSSSIAIDPPRATQAWLQLCDNAAKYSPAGSTIELAARRFDDRVELSVSDQGGGIPAEFHERIFERFGRVATNRGISGSGLGLPIVKAIADAHGGTVTLTSSTSGTTFTIVLPQNASSIHQPEAVNA